MQTPFGYHLILDCYKCDPSTIDNISVAYKYLEDLVGILEMNMQAPPYVFRTPPEYPDKAGLSGWVPLVESGITIHTLSVYQFISIDVYSCRFFSDEEVIHFTEKVFRFQDYDAKLVQRGIKYTSK